MNHDCFVKTYIGLTRNMAPEKLCDICLCPSHHSQENEVQVKREFYMHPGSEGCYSLNEQLRMYFVTTKLLKLPESENLKGVINKNGSKKRSNSNENRTVMLFSTMCTRCEIIVDEALELHVKMVTMQEKIDQLGKILVELKTVADDKVVARKKRKYTTISSTRLACSSYLHASKKIETETAREMLGVSLACLGKPTEKSSFGSSNSSKQAWLGSKLITRTQGISNSNKKDNNVDKCNYRRKIATENKFVENAENRVQVKVEDTDILLLALENIQEEEGLQLRQMNLEENESVDLDDENMNMKNLENVQRVTDNEDSNDVDYEPEENTDTSEIEYQDDDDDDDNGRKADRNLDDENCANEVESPATAIITRETLSSRVLDVSKGVMIPQCTTCGKIFSHEYSLNAHALRMHGIENYYTCSQCPDLKFSRKLLLVKHRKTAHGTICNKCGKQLSCAKSLRSHLKLVHKMSPIFTCHLCKIQFKTASQRRNHHAKTHVISKSALVTLPPRPPQTPEEEKWVKIPCIICGRKYLSGEALDNHILCRHERKMQKKEGVDTLPISCSFCWKSFHLEQRLAVHMMLFHPEIAEQYNFPCALCSDKNITFQSSSELLEHLEENHGNIPIHKCNKCGWPFLNEDLLKTHELVHQCVKPVVTEKEKVSKDTFPFKCWFCWDAFPDDAKFQKHLNHPRLHGNKGFKVEFYCDVESCEHHLKDPFSTVVDLNHHLASVHVAPSFIQKCTICSWGFVSPDMLELHKLNHVHSDKGKRPCPSCDHFSRSLNGLRKHYNIHHGKNLKLFKCPECGADFTSKTHLQQHSVHRHQVDQNEVDSCKKLPCDQCGKLYLNESSLKAHHLNSHGDYECKDCGQVLQTGKKFVKHRKEVHGHGQKYLCSECGKEFWNRFQLRIHMKSHVTKKYMCHLCHIRMADLEKMKEHIRRKHADPSEKKKFVCGQCGKGFGRKDSLEEHVRINHTKETWRVWSCDKCGRRFKRIGCLQKHQKGNGCDGPLETVIV